MKFSESWLREWVNPELTTEVLCDTLTMAGLEVEEFTPVAKGLQGVVIGQVLKVEKHPEADRLRLCEVDVAGSSPLNIVCGAPNVKTGMKVAVAMIGATLPDNVKITPAKIRGVESEGMLCSSRELGLSDDSAGLLELPADAAVGEDFRAYLQLDDSIIDVSITPNRGDCLSIRGMAREVAALTAAPLKEIEIPAVPHAVEDQLPVSIHHQAGCPRYTGRVIRGVMADTPTPNWLKEKLRRCGIRSISPVVDVTNYVMLELGQPMHAFDLNMIQSGIQVRMSRKGEKLELLDGSVKELDNETMLIADSEKPLAIAGVMGGMESGVTLLTRDIFLESAYFTPSVVARQRQYYNLNSDSAYRFERGIDPAVQRKAIERATRLILDICGGKAGPVMEVCDKNALPQERSISLKAKKIMQVLGISIDDRTVEKIFDSLGFVWEHEHGHWTVRVPLYRHDISLPEDLIEEIARLYGYNQIPTHKISGVLPVRNEGARDLHNLRQTWSDRGYHEVISYSFVDKKLQALLDPEMAALELLNPITAEMAVMRTSMWPGLVSTLLYNTSRQQHRVRLFEIGTCFVSSKQGLAQPSRLGGLISGLAAPEQWGMPSREVDFYDLKGDVEAVLAAVMSSDTIEFRPEKHPALHPGQSAGIYHQERKIGVIGALHPNVQHSLDLNSKVYVFELDLDQLQQGGPGRYHEISRFPEIRRDIAILVNQTIPVRAIQDIIQGVAGDWLQDVFIFDVYQGKGISPGLKSIALALIWQHPERTLVDDEVTALMERVITSLKGQLGAELRR